ncbi:MAG: 50S ribosomal protein L29 [Bacteroidetes bacterium]|jgi:large subunit ribosomal protein L29|nr:50S ribosomal protein L29 [Bacteroidota bacterium]
MTNEDIKQMNNKELHATLREERKQLQKMKFNHAVSPIENPTKITISRKTVARLLTEINARSSAAAKAE